MGPVGVITVYIVWAAYVYFKEYLIKGRLHSIRRSDRYLYFFILYGLLMVGLSLFGINQALIGDTLMYDRSYIFRQAYYLYFFRLFHYFLTGILSEGRKSLYRSIIWLYF